MEKVKHVVNTMKFVNLFLIFICIVGFVYQVFQISQQYMIGKTIVNIEVKRLKSQSLPGITVCIPALFSMPRLSELNNNNELYENYTRLLNESIAKRTNANEAKEKLKYLYKKISNGKFDKIFNFAHLLNNMSVNMISIVVTIVGKNRSSLNQTFLDKIHQNIQSLKI